VTWSRLASSKLLIFTLSSKTALFLLLPIFQLAWFLVKIYGIRARVGILLHLEILCGQAEGFKYHVQSRKISTVEYDIRQNDDVVFAGSAKLLTRSQTD